MLKTKTVVLLIDFLGHPILEDDYVNSKRYSELKKFITTVTLRNKKNMIFVSNMIKSYDIKLTEILKMARANGFNTLQISGPPFTDINARDSGDYTIEELSDEIFKVTGWKVDSNDTQIIIGGCNLGGCVITSKKFSAVYWNKLKFKTTIHLPLCADYEQHGTDKTEKAYNSFHNLYNCIKNYEAFNIKISNDINQIRFYEK